MPGYIVFPSNALFPKDMAPCLVVLLPLVKPFIRRTYGYLVFLVKPFSRRHGHMPGYIAFPGKALFQDIIFLVKPFSPEDQSHTYFT